MRSARTPSTSRRSSSSRSSSTRPPAKLAHDPQAFEAWCEENLEVRRRSNSELVAVCPIHQSSDTHRPDLYVNCDKGVFHCFSGSCAIRGTASQLVSLITGEGDAEAARTLGRSLPHAVSQILEALKRPEEPPFPRITWTQVRQQQSTHFWCDSEADGGRGFTREVADHFRLGYDFEEDEGLIPHFDVQGEPFAFIRRRRKKWGLRYLYPPRWPRESIFHLHAVDPRKEVVIVEGSTDAMRLWEAGVTNVVALLSSHVYPEQVAQLAHLRLVSFFDNDPAGLQATTRLFERYHRVFRVARYPRDTRATDPDKLSHGQLRTAVERAMPSPEFSRRYAHLIGSCGDRM